MNVATNGMTGLSEEAAALLQTLHGSTPVAVWSGTGRQGRTTLADCFTNWKDWFRDRDEIQARWDQRRMERATGRARGNSGGRGRL